MTTSPRPGRHPGGASSAADDAEPQARARSRPKLGHYTIHDVAALAGVSSVTASRYFNAPHKVSQKLRERLDAVVARTGYMPSQVARRLASTHGGPVGAVMQNVSSPTFAHMVRGMDDTLEAQGLQLLLANSEYSLDTEARAIRAFVGWHPSGLVLTRGDHDPAIETLLQTLRIPVVEAWEILAGRPYHQVGFAQRDVGKMLAEHFLQQGARRIRFALGGAAHDTRAERRAQGYAQAMTQAGLVADIVRVADADDYAAGVSHMARLVQESPAQRPEAIVFAHDHLAIGALLRAPAMGISIPRDCAVAGFGDVPLAEIIEPGLTSVRTRPYEIGQQAAAALLAAMQAPPQEAVPPTVHHVACQLAVRPSSKIDQARRTPGAAAPGPSSVHGKVL
ncbi:LacI family DNA-binding transcriptional regulator [Bordetella sp. BOR01]|uniref:LacI family DNA-binding transcriptional regulator n=1 Tax=Bordetella sp. BOR01 TaxID=2854779 RepID=UPI001C44C096|nr:LacI family DNA-binding transcriptional regulator [Bordetella sp. BOR01]MBV7482610.1 LacI family DNA-binding transcriptional regulator [Bordetella sp. BOR01]